MFRLRRGSKSVCGKHGLCVGAAHPVRNSAAADAVRRGLGTHAAVCRDDVRLGWHGESSSVRSRLRIGHVDDRGVAFTKADLAHDGAHVVFLRAHVRRVFVAKSAPYRAARKDS